MGALDPGDLGGELGDVAAGEREDVAEEAHLVDVGGGRVGGRAVEIEADGGEGGTGVSLVCVGVGGELRGLHGDGQAGGGAGGAEALVGEDRAVVIADERVAGCGGRVAARLLDKLVGENLYGAVGRQGGVAEEEGPVSVRERLVAVEERAVGVYAGVAGEFLVGENLLVEAEGERIVPAVGEFCGGDLVAGSEAVCHRGLEHHELAEDAAAFGDGYACEARLVGRVEDVRERGAGEEGGIEVVAADVRVDIVADGHPARLVGLRGQGEGGEEDAVGLGVVAAGGSAVRDDAGGTVALREGGVGAGENRGGLDRGGVPACGTTL